MENKETAEIETEREAQEKYRAAGTKHPETKAKFKIFAANLRRLSFPTSPISIDLAKFIASGLERYCDGNATSLDSAFGLTAKRGAPSNDGKREEIARQIFSMRLARKSWKQIAADLAAQDVGVNDERTLRLYYREFLVMLMSEELCRRLGEDDPAGEN